MFSRFSFGVSSKKTFKPVKGHQGGSKREELHQFTRKTLGRCGVFLSPPHIFAVLRLSAETREPIILVALSRTYVELTRSRSMATDRSFSICFRRPCQHLSYAGPPPRHEQVNPAGTMLIGVVDARLQVVQS